MTPPPSLAPHEPSLPDMHRSVAVPRGGSWIRRMFAFAGPAYLVSVGYMDPGNWATDLAGGSRLGYQLLWVLLMSNLMAVLLQTLSARLGVVTGRDLAQACRDFYPRSLVWLLWILCEIAIIACDLAEVLGAAIGLQLLFHVPLLIGVVVTALDVLLLLWLSRYGVRRLEAVILTLVATIGGCFAIEMILSRPDLPAAVAGLVPRDPAGNLTIFSRAAGGGFAVFGLHHESLYLALGILGATVMPHNLYLHSALVQSRAIDATPEGRREAAQGNLVDSVVALNLAFFVNAAILILAAATFHRAGRFDVATLQDAHHLLTPLLGTSLASTLFAVALLSAGQSSTITGTLAGQIVMEGFLRVRVQPWLRRLISRGLAIIPAVIVIALKGERAADLLLVFSQVVLSVQLSFAVIPLVQFTSDRKRMGEFVNPPWVLALAVLVTATIAGLNGKLVLDAASDWTRVSHGAWWTYAIAWPLALGLGGLLMLLLLMPWLQSRWPMFRPASDAAPIVMPAGTRATPAAGDLQVPAFVATLALHASAYQRIAVALELGAADESVLGFLHGLEMAQGAELVLVHVAESAASRYLGAESHDAETIEDERALENIAAELRLRGVACRVALGHGDVKREIARLVRESGADLLVTGSHGHTGIRDVVYGATVSGVRHLVGVPVLTVPPAPRR